MTNIPASPTPSSRANRYGRFGFHVVFIYFILQAVPLDIKYYRQLSGIDWGQLSYGSIFNLAHYSPSWSSGPQRYGDWIILLLIAVAGAIIWTLAERRTTPVDDEKAGYWLRVIARYRLATGIIAYGFLKLYPLQAPYPSLSNLNTNYGDFTRWKIFSLSLGIVPSYESFLGLVEIIGGLLLLYRRSASIGAFIIAVFLGNVFMSNLAYGGGDEVYSLYLISFALLILSYDAQRLADLLVFQRPASPNRGKLVFTAKWAAGTRLALKTAFILFFVVLYGFKIRSGYKSAAYQFPLGKGLDQAAGVYNVSSFRLNSDTLAYSTTDSLRWRDIVFESWSTLSIRSNRPVVLDSNNVERPGLADEQRTYELEGSAGRHYYSYETDTAAHILRLRNKNPHYAGEQLVLHYERPSPSRIVLSGIDQDKDSVTAVLDRIDKKYLLQEAAKSGRQGGLKL